jgi:hypothetical protein
MIRSSLRTYLLAQAPLAALIGDRLYPVACPETATLPAVTYRRASGGHLHNLTSASGAAIPEFELVVWAETYEDADEVAEAIRQEMQGFRGTMGSDAVKSVILDDEDDSIAEPDDNSDQPIYAITLRYRIQYVETKPTF